MSVKLSPDDQLIASGGKDIKIWRKEDLSQLLAKDNAHEGRNNWPLTIQRWFNAIFTNVLSTMLRLDLLLIVSPWHAVSH